MASASSSNGSAHKTDNRKHVVIIGAGAAGMSCAATLANHPEKYRITVLERASVCGGQATSIGLDKEKYGAAYMNDGVQGGSPAFKHTGHFFEKYGHSWHPVQLQVAFGKGPEAFWTNVFPSQLVNQYQADIKKFGKVLNLIKWTMPVLGLVPIRIMLRMFMFNKDFGDKMVYPLIALFLGTGNQTANVGCAILERLFHDPNMKLWDYDENTLLPNLPQMVTFPKLEDFYHDWRKDLESRGVEIRLNTDVTEVIERDEKKQKGGIVLKTRGWDPTANDHAKEFAPQVIHEPWGGPTSDEVVETYDTLVMCTLADQAKAILGRTATWRENFVLGGAKFFDDITITHSDADYFSKTYETEFKPDLAAEPRTEAQKKQLQFARKEIEENEDGVKSGYRPMYYTISYPEDPKCIEMSFDVTNYQHQFRIDDSKTGDTNADPGRADVPYENHVFQSIFLNKQNSDLWTMKNIDPEKVIESKWWHQLGHRWQHYVRVVPGMMFINGRNNTLFCGSWTLVNMHELACVSGIAAAYRLGADYERFDDFAENFFSKYLLLSHGVRYKPSKKDH